MPNVIVIAGPNGAGKSTLAPYLLRDRFGIFEFVNADTIAQGLSAFSPETAALDAGRVMLSRLAELADKRVDFAFETTLAAKTYARWLRGLQGAGYQVHIVFLWLSSPELAIQRVAQRVRAGGHNIPETSLRRRYERGLRNLSQVYVPLDDTWQIFDASRRMPIEIAFGGKMMPESILDDSKWLQIKNWTLTFPIF